MTVDECYHQVLLPESEGVSHTRHRIDSSLFLTRRRVRARGTSSGDMSPPSGSSAVDKFPYLLGFLVWHLDLLFSWCLCLTAPFPWGFYVISLIFESVLWP